MNSSIKPLPHDVDAERSLVGMLCDEWQEDAGYLTTEMFYDQRWRDLFTSAVALNARGEPVNAERLFDELRARTLLGDGRRIASISDVTECMNHIPPSETAGTLAARIHSAWQRQVAVKAMQELVAAAYDDSS